MPVVRNAGLRSDGELVQASADTFQFRETAERDHGGWIEIIDFSAPVNRTAEDPDDDGLPDTIIWCIDGDGMGTTDGAELILSYDLRARTWSVDGEPVDDAGMSALLFL